MADQHHIPPRDSTGCFVRVHGNPPPVQQPSPIQLASNQLQPIATMVQEVVSKSETFTQRAAHHHTTPQQVQAPREELVEDELEELETEGLIGTLEIIGPSLETFAQLPLPSARPSIIPCLSPSQGQTPLQPPPPPPPPPNPPPPPPPPTKKEKKKKTPPTSPGYIN